MIAGKTNTFKFLDPLESTAAFDTSSKFFGTKSQPLDLSKKGFELKLIFLVHDNQGQRLPFPLRCLYIHNHLTL